MSPRIAVPVDFRDITRRLPSAVPAPPPPAPAALAPTRQDPAAFQLLDEVAKALPALMARCERLEADLAATRESARADMEAANEVAREWQQIASALKLQVEGLENGLQTMKQRAEAAEERVLALRVESDASLHAAAEAECLSSLFQEKVMASFGAQSLVSPILEALRSKPAIPA